MNAAKKRGRAGAVANVQWTFAPVSARPWMAGPDRCAMDGFAPEGFAA